MTQAQEAKEMENGERLAKMEQKTDNIERLVTDINNKFNAFTEIYVPRTEINLMLEARDKQIDDVSSDLKEKADKGDIERIVKEKDNWQKNMPAWAAVIVAIIALVMPFLIN